MPCSADGSPPPADPAPLVGTEIETPVVTLGDGRAPEPQVFFAVWEDLAARGWTPGEFGVSRPHPSDGPSISSAQLMSTDTGPVFEIATAPAATVERVALQVKAMMAEAKDVLDRHGCRMIQTGVHPGLRPTRDEYYRLRTPRPAYDYAIAERGWHHWTIVDKAAVQEIVDVPFADAPRAIRVLHRLAGLMNFVLRNDPSRQVGSGILSVRPLSWRAHVPDRGRFAGDARRVLVPQEEITNWREYLALLWDTSPMFLVGTKNHGLAWVPEHPTFLGFMRRRERSWEARDLRGIPLQVTADAAHVAATDWSYMGFARIRWKWRHGSVSPGDIVDAWDRDAIEPLMERCLEKVVVENRCNSAQPEGDEIVSLALVAGLMANLDEAFAFVSSSPYAFWVRLLTESMRLPLRSVVDGREIPLLASEMIAIARRGLVVRGEASADRWLDPLRQRIEDGASPSERRLRARLT